MPPAVKHKKNLSASKKKLQSLFVNRVAVDRLSPAQAIERASVFPVSGGSKVLHWPKKF